MEEIVLKKNPSGLRIFINGKPDISQIEKKELESETVHLQLKIAELFEQKRTKGKNEDSY